MASEECRDCDGCGWYEGGETLQTTCKACNGTGRISTPPREEPPVQQSEAGMPELRNRSKAWWLNRARMEGDSPASVGRDFVMETARNLRDVAKIRRAKGQDLTFGPDECDRIAEMIDDLRTEITSMQQRLSALANAAEGCEAELRDGTLCGEYGPDRIALCGPCQRKRDTAILTLPRDGAAQ